MKLTSIIVAALVASAALTTIATAESKGKMANEWSISKIKAPDAEQAEAKSSDGGGGGMAKVEDILVTKNPTPDEPVKKKGIFLKLGAIKGE